MDYALHETAQIIYRIGIEKLYVPIAEFPIRMPNRRNLLFVDWVWMDQAGRIRAAFEIEGRNVGAKSLSVDVIKFNALKAEKSFVVTYGKRYKEEGWVELKEVQSHLSNFRIQNHSIEVLKAEELLKRFKI